MNIDLSVKGVLKAVAIFLVLRAASNLALAVIGKGADAASPGLGGTIRSYFA